MEMVYLDTKRAKEIVASTGIIDVLLDNSSVWIESVNDNNTVKVHHISNNKKEEVPVDRLLEN